MIPANSAAVLGALLKPSRNYAAEQGAKMEALQLQGILTTQKQQEVAEEEAAQAQAEQFMQAVNSLPFEGRDKQKLSQYMKGEERALFTRLRDGYAGDYRKFMQAEGSTWMQGAATRLQSSPFYQQATLNRQNVLLAKQALQKGERILGSDTPGGYVSGEQYLAQYINGQTDAFDLKGTYKPDTDAAKELREQYAPNRLPWERVAATPDEVAAHLVSKYGAEVGRDLYERNFKGVPVYYRSDKITDAVRFGQDNSRFNMEVGKYRMAQDDQRMQRAAFGSSEALRRKQGQLLDAKIAETNRQGQGGRPYDHYLLSSPSEMVQLRHDPANPKQLANGVDLGKVNALAGVTLYGNGDDILARQLGLQRTRDGYRGSFGQAFTTENGVNAINLKGVSYDILGVDSKAFYNPADFGPNADQRKPLNGYARVTLKFSPYEAEKAGLYDPNRLPWIDKNKPTSTFDSETRLGTSLYNPATGTATLYVPAGDLRNPNFLKAMQRDEKGTKSANEDFTAPAVPLPYLKTGF